MLSDILYSTLKQDQRAYEIMLLRDQHANTFADIATACEISAARAAQLYNTLKIKQISLYINHIAMLLGHSDTSQVRKIYDDAYECYRERSYACAYLEKKYSDIVTEYRAGEPGMPAQFVRHMPPFKPKLSKETVSRIIEMRVVEKASFVSIAKALRITQSKARHTYETLYHKRVLALLKALEQKVESQEEKDAIWAYYFKGNKSAKKTL